MTLQGIAHRFRRFAKVIKDAGGRGATVPVSVMTSEDSLLLILRRLDEIERKLEFMLEELRAPTLLRGI